MQTNASTRGATERNTVPLECVPFIISESAIVYDISNDISNRFGRLSDREFLKCF